MSDNAHLVPLAHSVHRLGLLHLLVLVAKATIAFMVPQYQLPLMVLQATFALQGGTVLLVPQPRFSVLAALSHLYLETVQWRIAQHAGLVSTVRLQV